MAYRISHVSLMVFVSAYDAVLSIVLCPSSSLPHEINCNKAIVSLYRKVVLFEIDPREPKKRGGCWYLCLGIRSGLWGCLFCLGSLEVDWWRRGEWIFGTPARKEWDYNRQQLHDWGTQVPFSGFGKRDVDGWTNVWHIIQSSRALRQASIKKQRIVIVKRHRDPIPKQDYDTVQKRRNVKGNEKEHPWNDEKENSLKNLIPKS